MALLEVGHVGKRFGATKALTDVSLSIEPGTIHSLLGRNGAGKSTVVNCIAGVYPHDSGTILFEGQDVSPFSIFERQKMGIRMVTQHASVIPELSIAENIFLGLWPKKKTGVVDWKTMFELADEELKRYGLDASPLMKVKDLSAVDMRKVNIVRAMHGGAKLVILDEPTTALSSAERDELFEFVNELKSRGTAFIFISHYLNEVVQLSDEITVIRDGLSFPGTGGGEPPSEERLANLIAGGEVALSVRSRHCEEEDSNIALECKNVSGPHLHNVSFKVHKKQIVGVIGFPGSGAREMCRTLFGLERQTGGSVSLFGGKPLRLSSPSQALENKVAYISHDRHNEGIIPSQNILDNISLPILKTFLRGFAGSIDKSRAVSIAKNYCELLNVKCNSVSDKLSSLSGGNQQKVVVGKTLSSKPKILILDEPTIGIDIKSREEIIAIVSELAETAGLAVLYLTNDFDELIRVADRMLFFKDGHLTADIANIDLTLDDIVRIRDNGGLVSAVS
jgi:ABC-type sugar transport system ATPase subunit